MKLINRAGLVLASICALSSVVACSPQKDPKVASAPPATSTTQPNIIFIFSDDLSFRGLSAYGQEKYTTPHLDELASVSVRFTNGY